MSDDLPRRGLLNGFLALLPGLSYSELRALDVPLQTLLMQRGGDRQWQRRIATGPGDVDQSWHLVGLRRIPAARSVVTACNGAWRVDDEIDASANPPLEERCHACWRAACGGSAIGMALLEVVGQIAILDRDRAELREQARDEMVGIRIPDRLLQPRIVDDRRLRMLAAADAAAAPEILVRLPDDDLSDRVVVDEFELDKCRTRLDPTPAVIALCEQGRDRDPDLEVDLGFDVSDADQPIGPQLPDYDFEGGEG